MLVLVDDFQWIDPQSQQILLFIIRRVATERIAVVIAERAYSCESLLPADLATIELIGLSVGESRIVADTMEIDISDEALRQLVTQTAGNPLALVETMTSAAERSVPGPRDEVRIVGITPTVRRAWSSTFDRFSASTVVALFALVASRSNDLTDLELVLADLGLSLADLAPAERSALVTVESSRIDLRPP